jgi:hypothetical protein
MTAGALIIEIYIYKNTYYFCFVHVTLKLYKVLPDIAIDVNVCKPLK